MIQKYQSVQANAVVKWSWTQTSKVALFRLFGPSTFLFETVHIKALWYVHFQSFWPSTLSVSSRPVFPFRPYTFDVETVRFESSLTPVHFERDSNKLFSCRIMRFLQWTLTSLEPSLHWDGLVFTLGASAVNVYWTTLIIFSSHDRFLGKWVLTVNESDRSDNDKRRGLRNKLRTVFRLRKCILLLLVSFSAFSKT